MNPKVKNIFITKGDPNDYTKIGPRLYRMNGDGEIKVFTDIGVFTFRWKKGFVTDGRSGGVLVDPIFPHWGKRIEKALVIMHDILFHDFDISFETANNLLRNGAKWIGYSWLRYTLVHKGVSTCIARKAFGCKTDKEWANRKLCDCRWDAK